MKESEFNISNESIIRNAIQERIMNNELKPGDTLPSENVLADEFGMKRIVVRNALVQLEKMGLLDSRQGVGRFVKEKRPVIELDMSGRRSFSDKMREQGVDYESKVIFAGMRRSGSRKNTAKPLRWGMMSPFSKWRACVSWTTCRVPSIFPMCVRIL
ncbi:GntR family transcriptional regulator [Salinicoccus roseus]|uniref:GntR family transcriptional regulator n=1 Tax=Salinicoccus roseus TaxID=45670 RepID=UPI0023000398|nr:GntR family transcriptional regulator [Salinicoccus roseus]